MQAYPIGLLCTCCDAASRYIALECLALSPQYGFALVATGNNITPEAQERKLTLVVTGAQQG